VSGDTTGLRRTVAVVALFNGLYFAVEFAVAVAIGSVSLFADSIDFLEDTSVNLLILIGLAWTVRSRARLGMALAVILLIPGLATIVTGVQKLWTMTTPEPVPLSLAGVGALTVNLTCAMMLARHRHREGGLALAAFLSARNDAIANVAIVLAGLVTARLWHSAWPDLIVGLGIAILNADAAREVWKASREEVEAEP
jgi:Co/Zn/Cd efflux system component